MNVSELMDKAEDAYLAMNRPSVDDPATLAAVARIVALQPEVSDRTISELISNGPSWRERLVGLVLAVNRGQPSFADAIIDSFRKHPTGLAFVPAFAALVLMTGGKPSRSTLEGLSTLNRTLFDGDLGWSMDKFLFHVGCSPCDPGGMSPNDGKSFEDNLEVFKLIKDTQHPPGP
jgi:hypothetical protein